MTVKRPSGFTLRISKLNSCMGSACATAAAASAASSAVAKKVVRKPVSFPHGDCKPHERASAPLSRGARAAVPPESCYLSKLVDQLARANSVLDQLARV